MIIAIIIPLIGALLIGLFGHIQWCRNIITITSSLLLLVALVLYALGSFETGSSMRLPIIIPQVGLFLSCSIEGLIFALMVSVLWVVANLYSIGYMACACDRNQKRFFFFVTLSISCVLGVAFSGDIITMFIFYEMITLATYPLIVNRLNETTFAAGKTYLQYLLGSSLLLLFPAVALTYYLLGGADYSDAITLSQTNSSLMNSILLGMFVYGIAKAALMPMHKWLIAAMVAQTPVSALLHAVIVVKSGVFFIIKNNFYVFGVDWIANQYWLVFLASFTIIAGSICALRATHLKVMLAYSTISQLSYIILFSVITDNILLPMFYLVFHAFAKITLFFVAGAISTRVNTQEIVELDGIGKSMPWSMVCFAVSGFSMIGVPFTGMFVGKMMLLSSAVNQPLYLFIVCVVVLSTVLNTLYFLPLIYNSFFSNKTHGCTEIGWVMRLPMIFATTCNMLFFICMLLFVFNV